VGSPSEIRRSIGRIGRLLVVGALSIVTLGLIAGALLLGYAAIIGTERLAHAVAAGILIALAIYTGKLAVRG
jgi:hypothetical protein